MWCFSVYIDRVTNRDGITHTFGWTSPGDCSDLINYYEDPNGNRITQNYLSAGGGACVPTGWTDSADRTINISSYLTQPADTTGCTGPLPTTGAALLSIPTFNSGSLDLKLCFAGVVVNIPSLCQQSSCVGSPDGAYHLIQSIVLPNGTAWTFQWDTSTDGSTAYGDLLKITFPTGGTISYTWGSTSAVCDYGVGAQNSFGRSITSRTVDANDGTGPHTWTYTFAGTVNAPEKVVTDPDGNQTIHYFSPWNAVYGVTNCTTFYETSTQYFQGTSNLLKTVTTNYVSAVQNGSTLRDQPGALAAGITTAFPGPSGPQNRVETDYEYPALDYGQYPLSDGNVVAQREYDYGNGAPGALLRTTTTTYEAVSNNVNYQNGNLWSLVSSVTVKNGAGTQQGYTGFNYDEYGLVSSGIAAQHDLSPPDGSFRGNQTSVRKWMSDSTSSTTNCPISVNNGYVISFAVYNDTGTVDHTVDSCGSNANDSNHETAYSYSSTQSCPVNSFGTFPTIVTNPLGQATNSCYDYATGLIESTTDPNGQTTQYNYDSMSRLLGITYPPGGGSAGWGYNDSPPNPSFTFTRTASPDPNFEEIGVVDGLGREIQTQTMVPSSTCPSGVVDVDTTYDNEGRKATGSNPHCSSSGSPTDGTTTYKYDPLNRVTSIIEQDGSTVRYDYSQFPCTTITDEAGKQRESCVDGLGHLTFVSEDPNGANYQSAYTYDALDNLRSVSQSGSRQRSFTFDSLSLLTLAFNPESGPVSYSYDANGNVVSKTDALGNTTNFSPSDVPIDALNRVRKVTYNGNLLATYGYDGNNPSGCAPTLAATNGIGRRTGMCDAGGWETWTYDPMGRVTDDRRFTNNVPMDFIYAYDQASVVDSIGYPSGRTVTYSPLNNALQVVQAVDSANSLNYATGGTYAPTGALSSLMNGANIISTWYYNNRYQGCRMAVNVVGTTVPGSCADGTSSGNVLDLIYNYGSGNNGNVASIGNSRDSTRSQTFAYDNLNRLASAQTSSTYATSPANCWGESYVYDQPGGPSPWGNLVQINAVSSVYTGCTQESLSMAVNAKNHLLDTNGNDTFYDGVGNMTTLPSGVSVSYNGNGQISAINGVSYVYDGDGKRIEKLFPGGAKLYWYGLNGSPLDESDGGGNISDEYIFFNGKRIAHRLGP